MFPAPATYWFIEKSLYLCSIMKDDKTLIEQLNQSDKTSFEALYDKYVGMVYGFINSVLKNETLAEDLTQWCFMQLWEHRQTISADRNLPAWLYVTARNAAFKEMRRQLAAARCVDSFSNSSDVACFEEAVGSDAQVILQEINKVIDTLPESRKRIFTMKTVEGKSVTEIAEELKISPKTVETQIYRAKATLKEHVSKLLYLAVILTFHL